MSSSPAVLVIGASGAIGSPLINDLGPVMATVLRDLKTADGRAYHLAAESASMTEVADLLGEITGQPWRYEPAKPQAFSTSKWSRQAPTPRT